MRAETILPGAKRLAGIGTSCSAAKRSSPLRAQSEMRLPSAKAASFQMSNCSGVGRRTRFCRISRLSGPRPFHVLMKKFT